MKEYRFVRGFDGVPLTPWRPIPADGVSAMARKIASMYPKDRIDYQIRPDPHGQAAPTEPAEGSS